MAINIQVKEKIREMSIFLIAQRAQPLHIMKDLKEDWNETKLKLKQKFAMLTNSDILLMEGKQEEMLARLQIKLGKTKEELRKLIAEL